MERGGIPQARLMEGAQVARTASRLLGYAVEAHLLAQGANGRVYRLHGEHALVAKVYSPPEPARPDRCAVEWTALNFLYGAGCRDIPRPVAQDAASSITLMSFVPGRRLASHEIELTHALSAAQFLVNLLPLRQTPQARQIGEASDAGFSIAQHLDHVQNRFARLARELNDDDALRFLQGEVARALERVAAFLAETPAAETAVPVQHRILSPSDFGFHNILAEESGCLWFLDFEYFGWDDAAKAAADFRHQPEVALSPQCFEAFRQRLVETIGEHSAALDARIERLLPLAGVKWTMIMLNAFRAGAREPPEGKQTRLERARSKLQGVERAWRDR